MKLLVFILFFSSLYGVTININNDSLYNLEVTTYSGSDVELTTLHVNSGHTIKWQDSFFDAKDYSKGPYTIVFTCPEGDEYGTSTNGRSKCYCPCAALAGKKKMWRRYATRPTSRFRTEPTPL